MYKLLALDLDGTVLNSNNTISPVLVDTIKRISQQTHVVIVTGRHHVAAEPYYRELGLTTPIICCNGTYIFDYQKNTILNENAIEKHNASEFISLAESNNLKMVMYVRDAMLYSNREPIDYMEELCEWSNSFPDELRPNIRKVDNFLTELNDTDYIWKFVVEGINIDEFTNIPFIKDNFNGERSWSNRTDFANAGNSKGNALISYTERLGITPQQVVAIGDNHNDISMLKFAGLGIAMINAESAVKNTADLVTDFNNDHLDVLSELLTALFEVR